LAAVKSGDTLLGGCTNCRGVWVDRKIFDKIARRDSLPREVRRSRSAGPQRLKCPICYYWMEAKNFGDSPDHVIDVCRRHGTWLDANELQSILRVASQRKNPDAIPTPAMPTTVATVGVVAAASSASTVDPQNRSTLERVGELGELVLDLADFLPDLGDVGNLAGDVVSGIAEIGFGLFDGL
jgi:Zn-finger nucleic acid-binding protein